MYKYINYSSLLYLILFCSTCSTPTTTTPTKRALDTWVVRLNLDGRPEMIGLALHKDLYAAYDASMASLYKVWKGNIKFTGPVYDNLHGPQPSVQGKAYIHEKLEESPWKVLLDDKVQKVEVDYESYVLRPNEFTLKYSLILPDGQVISIEETPDYIQQEGQLGFRRQFTIVAAPNGVEVLMDASFIHLNSKESLTTDGIWQTLEFTEGKYDWGTSISANGRLQLNPKGTTYLESFFQTKATETIEVAEQATAQDKSIATSEGEVETTDDLDALATRGKNLLGKNDCSACHLNAKALIGPSYTMVAQKYEQTIANAKLLGNKIISGGSGVWGQQAMSAHPDLSEQDATSMAAYILSMVPDDPSKRKPGVAVDFYQVGEPLASLPEIVAGQNPNVSVVYPNINFISGNPDIGEATDENFSGFGTDFVMEVNGYLNVPATKTYDIQFVANNGGKLLIDGELMAQGHFYEGTFEDHFEITLTEGAHKIQIEFYHHLFDKYLQLQWRANKTEAYQTIPASYFSHDPFHIKPTSPGIKAIIKNNAPGFGASLEQVHPAFDLSSVRPEGFQPRVGDLEFRQNGNLVLCTWDGAVYELTNPTSIDPSKIKVTKIATGLCEPLGITEVNGDIYVLQRWELTKLIDHNKDGLIDEYARIASIGSSAQFHEWTFGLIYKEGYFYCTTGIAMGRGADNMSEDRGKALKIAMDGTYSYIAHGLKEPNGIGFGVDGEIFVTENEGEFIPICKVLHLPTSGNPFYGNKSVEADQLPEDIVAKPPVIWLPQNEIGNSPSQPILMKYGPYEGQMLHGEITHGGIKRDFIEKVKGAYQGAVFRFTQGLEVGINRLEWGPDGSLYAAGLGGNQDYGHKGHQFGLQRLTYNGQPAFEMLAIRAKSNGLEIEFTKPLRIGDGTVPEDYKIQQWFYTWTEEGESQEKRELENLPVKSVTLLENRKKVFLEIPGMKTEHVLYVQLQPTFLSEENDQLWSNEGWYTLNRIPDEPGQVGSMLYATETNTLSTEEIKAGWMLLFDGKNLDNWNAQPAEHWDQNPQYILGNGTTSLLASKVVYDNFELELEWQVNPAAKGGILFNIPKQAAPKLALKTAPRFHLTDDQTEEAKNIHTHKSGANYDIQQPKYVVTNPPNNFNHARLVVRGKRVEHWINGIKVVNYELESDSWKQAVAQSSYSSLAVYGESQKGSIGLFVEEGKIWFRNIRIRELNNQDDQLSSR